MDFAPWWSVIVPAGTPQPIVDKLAAWFRKISEMPETKEFLRQERARSIFRRCRGRCASCWSRTPRAGANGSSSRISKCNRACRTTRKRGGHGPPPSQSDAVNRRSRSPAWWPAISAATRCELAPPSHSPRTPSLLVLRPFSSNFTVGLRERQVGEFGRWRACRGSSSDRGSPPFPAPAAGSCRAT